MRYILLFLFSLICLEILIGQDCDIKIELESDSKYSSTAKILNFIEESCPNINRYHILMIQKSHNTRFFKLKNRLSETNNFLLLDYKDLEESAKIRDINHLIKHLKNIKLIIRCNNGPKIDLEGETDFIIVKCDDSNSSSSSSSDNSNSGRPNLENIDTKIINLKERATTLSNRHKVNPLTYKEFNESFKRISDSHEELKINIQSSPQRYKQDNVEFAGLVDLIDKLKKENHLLYSLKDKPTGAETLSKTGTEEGSNSSDGDREVETVLEDDDPNDGLTTTVRSDEPKSETTTNSNSDEKRSELKNQIKQLNANLETCKNEIENRNSTIANLTGKVDDKNEEIRRLKNTNNSQASEIRTLEIENENLNTANSRLSNKNRELKKDLKTPFIGLAISGILSNNFPTDYFTDYFKLGGRKLELVAVEGGEFDYGITSSQYEDLLRVGAGKALQFDNEIVPSHRQNQKIEINYFIGKYEITNAQYKAMVKSHKYKEVLDDDKPIVNLSYGDMLLFCKRLNEHFGFGDYGVKFDLPTEKEWEYAARGNDGGPYPWGRDYKTGTQPNANVNGLNPLDVGRYESGKSWCGAYDMIGNVYEACKIDKINYEKKNTAEVLAARGGSFRTKPLSSRVTSRYTLFGEKKRDDLGFRVVLRVQE